MNAFSGSDALRHAWLLNGYSDGDGTGDNTDNCPIANPSVSGQLK